MHKILLGLLVCSFCGAQELSIYKGQTKEKTTNQQSFSYEIDYRQLVNDVSGFSVLYLNEGHFPNHHKDLFGLETYSEMFISQNVSFSVGVGVGYICDTQNTKDTHTFGLLSTGSLTYYYDTIFSRFTINQVNLSNNNKTTTYLLGFGYTKQPITKKIEPDNTDRELSVLYGASVLNAPGCFSQKAYDIKYTKNITPNVSMNYSFINEGFRKGIAVQLQTNTNLTDTMKIGVSAGPYFIPDTSSYIVSFIADKQINSKIKIKTSFNRIITNTNKDTDIFLAGIGYNF